MYRLLALLALLAACGSTPKPHTSEAELALGGSSVGLAAFTFDDTRITTTARATFTIENVGDADTGVIVAQVTGDASYAVDPASPCIGQTLAASATCDVTVVFTPSMTGGHDGTLEITASPGGLVSLDIHGNAAALGITFDPQAIDFGTVEVGPHALPVHISNTATDPIAITSLSINGPVYSVTSSCGASIPGGGSCDATVTMSSAAVGMFAATMTLDSSGVLTAAPVTGAVGGSVTIVKAGEGSGSVTSSTGGLDCGATCTALIASSFTLTAVPDLGSSFLGWSEPSCGAALTCVLPTDVLPRTITATFVSLSPSMLTVTFAGDATGAVMVRRTPTGSINWVSQDICTASCTIPIAGGDTIDLVAASPSNLGGWSGDCTSSVSDCTFVATGNAAVTATFTKDPTELSTQVLLPGETIVSATFDSMNRLVLGTTVGVVAFDATGATRWTVPTVPDPSGTGTVSAAGRAVIDTNDNVYVAADRTLAKLDPNGNVLWTIDLGATVDPGTGTLAHELAASPDGDLAIQAGTMLDVYASDGTLRWSAGPLPLATAHAVAVDHAGNVGILVSEGDVPQDLHLFAPDGTPLPASTFRVTPEYEAELAFDSLGGAVTAATGDGHMYVERTLVDGTLVFGDVVNGIDTPEPAALAVADDDSIVSVYEPYRNYTGFIARRHSPTGLLQWSVSRPPQPSVLDATEDFGIDAMDVAVDHTGRVAIVGAYVGVDGASSAIVQIFQP